MGGGTGHQADGVVLVRPDKHVAWRAAPAPGMHETELSEAVQRLLSGASATAEGVNDQELLTGIESAAAALRS